MINKKPTTFFDMDIYLKMVRHEYENDEVVKCTIISTLSNEFGLQPKKVNNYVGHEMFEGEIMQSHFDKIWEAARRKGHL